MPVITITKIADRTKTSAKGKRYKVVTVEGTKYGTDEAWSTDIFKNKTDLLAELENFGPGETANFKFVKNGNFWDLNEIMEPTEENLEYAKENATNPTPRKSTANPGGRSGSGGKSSSGLSKAEWAEKDRLTNIRISKAVALKAAVENTKMGTSADTIIKHAEEFILWLLDTDGDSVTVDPEDALAPPVEE